jgi:hypothetical protein
MRPYERNFVMSAETAASKKSFLTRAMENVRAKQNADSSDEYNDHPAVIADNKKFAKIAVVAAVGTVAVLALSWKTLSKMAPVEEETSEETTSQD